MSEYGKANASEPTTPPEQPAQVQDEKAEKAAQVKNGCVGCLAVLVLMGGCSALISLFTPENLTKKCEKDLKSRYELQGYSFWGKTGFVTVSKPVEPTMISTIAWQFLYKGKSAPGLEDAAPLYYGRAVCRIDMKTKKVKTIYERINRLAGE